MFPILTFKEGGWCNALGRAYAPGYYRPNSREEYMALAPFAVNAPALPDVDTDPTNTVSGTVIIANPDINTATKDELMETARLLGLTPSHNIGVESGSPARDASGCGFAARDASGCGSPARDATGCGTSTRRKLRAQKQAKIAKGQTP